MAMRCRACGWLAYNRADRSSHCCCANRHGDILTVTELDHVGERWKRPRIDSRGRARYLDVVDIGTEWMITDFDGMTHAEPKDSIVIHKSLTPSHCRAHFL
jgi:hypothetical protein